jgi:hypothetical protein
VARARFAVAAGGGSGGQGEGGQGACDAARADAASAHRTATDYVADVRLPAKDAARAGMPTFRGLNGREGPKTRSGSELWETGGDFASSSFRKCRQTCSR